MQGRDGVYVAWLESVVRAAGTFCLSVRWFACPVASVGVGLFWKRRKRGRRGLLLVLLWGREVSLRVYKRGVWSLFCFHATSSTFGS